MYNSEEEPEDFIDYSNLTHLDKYEETVNYVLPFEPKDHYVNGEKVNQVRRFDSGGVRDLDKDKLDFEGFLSAIVLEEFAKYMHKHRYLLNGEFRDSDNWQLGFGDLHFTVCMKSLWRHFFDLWKEHRGFKSREGIQDALNGILFNTMAYYHKFILENKKDKEKYEKENTENPESK